MKKFIFAALLACTISFTAGAEEPEHYYAERYDVRYRDIAGFYNPHTYQAQDGDPYSPAISGIASFLLPGLGQCLDDEWGRGIGIVAANCGFGLLELTEASLVFYAGEKGTSYYRDNGFSSPRYDELMGVSLSAMILTAGAHLALNLWNIYDAVQIAKVKNLYYRDIRAEEAFTPTLRIEPQLAFAPVNGNVLQPTAGVSLKLNF